MKEHFVIKGKRDFIVNKVENEYIGYDRLDLEYYSLMNRCRNTLLYFQKFSLDNIVELLQQNYDVSATECKQAIISFLEETPNFTYYLCKF